MGFRLLLTTVLFPWMCLRVQPGMFSSHVRLKAARGPFTEALGKLEIGNRVFGSDFRFKR